MPTAPAIWAIRILLMCPSTAGVKCLCRGTHGRDRPVAKTDSTEIREGRVDRIESVETTHVSIVDPAGNAVAMTTTLNGNFGQSGGARCWLFFE